MEEKRKEFISASEKADRNISKLCREFGISRKTGYKWIARYRVEKNVSNQSKTPYHIANKTDEETQRAIIELRNENPGWGAKKLHQILSKEIEMPCIKTVNNILSRNNLITPESAAARHQYIRFQKEYANDMWQTDFKGEFKMLDNKYCYPLTILDDCSRFSISIQAFPSQIGVLSGFKKAFSEYGFPQSVLSDNGGCFAGFKGGYTQFERYLMDVNVLPIHGRIKHPQTQGKIERFHRSMKDELLKFCQIANLEQAQIELSRWRDKYNNIRPHEALNNLCPADVYTKSTRDFTDVISEYDYCGEFNMVKINNWGYLRYMNYRIYFSETFADTSVEIRPSQTTDTFKICYRNFIIGRIDATTGTLLNRKCYRLE